MTLDRPTWLQDFPRREHEKPGGRRLWLYGQTGATEKPGEELPATEPPSPHLRWHPFRRQWVAYAAARQTRTFKPDASACPLCPAIAGKPPGEIPFSQFDVAVFENRFPGFAGSADASMVPAGLPVETAVANGACEVVVFSADHQGSLAELGQTNREILIAAWTDRFLDLYERPEIKAVLPFENRGEEVGVTLHHPHGQIYAFPFVPPVLQDAVTAFSEGSTITGLAEEMGDSYTVARNATMHAFVPPFARFPYEVWITSDRRTPGPWDFSFSEVRDFAALLGEIVARYDALFDKVFPYIFSLQAAPKGHEQAFHFTAQFYPLLRTADKLKYLAGVEQGSGTFLMDALPEVTAQRLRELSVTVS